MTWPSKILRGTVSGTYLYVLKAAHMVYSTGVTHVLGCFYWKTPKTGHPVNVIHMTWPSKILRGTVSGTYLYVLKAVHVVYSTGVTHVLGCFSWKTPKTGHPVLVQDSSSIRHYPTQNIPLPIGWTVGYSPTAT